jgi:Asp-tRNA(Asn)/Glu-tRNA(Gln) amidotransferase A subunit family amidase
LGLGVSWGMKKLLPAVLLAFALGAFVARRDEVKTPVTSAMTEAAGRLVGLAFSPAERDSMQAGLSQNRDSYEALQKIDLPNAVAPALLFNPLPAGFVLPTGLNTLKTSPTRALKLPADRHALAFMTVEELAELIRTRQISSEELTQFFLNRLRTYGPALHNVITLTDSLALTQARQADREIKAGKYRGPLHGMPYGAKDLLARRGYPTTWGSVPFKNQRFDYDATVVKRLEAAGAVLCAKLAVGELAWGDVWFGGMSRNPWKPETGSSGSSAGSGSGVAAGLLPFAIGTETLGSIVSPSTVCGVTGLRPTFGRVSRHGAMALSWSMDKIGPMARSVEDLAVIFNAIQGPDGHDATVQRAAFRYAPLPSLAGVRVGYVKKAFDSRYANHTRDSVTLAVLQKLGAVLVPIDLPTYPLGAMTIILNAEGAASFDELTRSGRDSLLVRQVRNAWPNVFRTARLIPAVAYVQANRIRTKLIEDMHQMLTAANVSVYVSPTYAGGNLTLTNLTGHPCVVLPNGFTTDGLPTSITFMGQLFGEGQLLAVAKSYQDATDWNRKHPVGF